MLAVASWDKSPAPADPTCRPFPSCLGDPFNPYSWHLLPLPWSTSQDTSCAPVPCAHRQLLQEGGEATQIVLAAGPAPLITSENWRIPPHQAPNAGKASMGHEEWAPDSVTGRVTGQCHNLKELEATKQRGSQGMKKHFRAAGASRWLSLFSNPRQAHRLAQPVFPVMLQCWLSWFQK